MRSTFSEERTVGSQDGTGDPLGGAGAPSRPPGPRSQPALVAAGSLLVAIASRALVGVKNLWNRVPDSVSRRVHAALDWTGVPYFLNYIASYDARHQLSNFAGNLVALHAAQVGSSTEQRQTLAQQFEEITESLIMKNGVKKSTHPMRQHSILTKVLADPRCRPDKPAIKVLEIPSSIGMTALDNFATLSQHYGIRAYVLGDLFWQLHYDMDRECVFDDEFNLLQVKQKNRFFSIYRPGQSGSGDGLLAAVWLFPFELMSRYLKRRYVYSASSNTVPIRVLHPDAEAIRRHKQHKGCFVLGTNIEAEALSDEEVVAAYKAQSQVEGGLRFLKDPLFFVSALFVKKPTRIQGLLMVMTVALLVYSVAQRRLRQALARQKESLPNQINQPTQRPTLRWVFQLLEGIHRVRVIVQDQVYDLIEGLNEVQIKILRLFGQEVCQIYQISSA